MANLEHRFTAGAVIKGLADSKGQPLVHVCNLLFERGIVLQEFLGEQTENIALLRRYCTTEYF